MKKIYLSIVLVMAMVTCAVASDMTSPVKINWKDSNLKTAGYFWTVFMSDSSGGDDFGDPVATINYVAGQTVFTTEQQVSVSGQGGSTIRRFFVMKANNADGVSANASNEVSLDFSVPLDAPYEVTIEFVIQTK